MTTNIIPGVTNSGKLFSNRDTVKQNLTEDLNFGRRNARHYSNSNIADGSTDARTAILAADAEGPVVLPPGTYAIASNMTLTNNILLEPGAKLKPANGVTVTLNGGYSAEDTQHVFDISAGGTFTVPTKTRPYVTPHHFGAASYTTINTSAATDSSPAFNAACLAVASDFDANVMRDAGIVRVAPGAYGIGSPVKVRSGVRLIGAGPQTEIHKLSSWVAQTGLNAIAFELWGGNNNLCSSAEIKGFQFFGDFTAVRPTSSEAGYTCRPVDCIFESLHFDCKYGVILDTIAISCTIRDLRSHGTTTNLEQIIKVCGNENLIDHFEVEGMSGATSEPQVLIDAWAYTDGTGSYTGNSGMNRMFGALIEGGGGANKVALEMKNCSRNTIYGLYVENFASSQPALRLEDCTDVHIAGAMYLVGRTVQAVNSKAIFNRVDISGEGIETVGEFFDLTNSVVHVENLITYTNKDSFQISGVPGLVIGRSYSSLMTNLNPAGVVNHRELKYNSGCNLLSNSTFTNGEFGWTISSTGTNSISDLGASPIASGRVLTVNNLANGDISSTYQTFAVSAAQVGHPITVTMLVEAVSGAANGFACPFISGCGIDLNASTYDTASVGAGWVVVSTTVIPQSAGNINIGVQGVYVTALNVASVTATPGTTATGFYSGSKDIALNNRSFRCLSAAPTTGTGNVGDFVFNSNPSDGAPVGWQCITAGSPGTWRAQYKAAGPSETAVVNAVNAGVLNWINLSGNNYLSGITHLRDGSGVTNATIDGNTGVIKGTEVFDELNAKYHGAVGDGSTNDRAAIATADTLGAVALPSGTYHIASNLTINNSIKFEPGAKIKPANGVTVTLNGGYSAEDTQHVFDISAGGSIVLSKKQTVRPDHWGAVADGVTDSTNAINAALVASGNSLQFNPGTYVCSAVCNPNNAGVTILGNNTRLTAAAANQFALQIKTNYGLGSCRISNIEFFGHQANRDRHGLYVNNGSALTLDHCWFSYCDMGLVSNVTIDCTYYAPWFRNNRVGAYFTSRNSGTGTLSFTTPQGQTLTLTDDALNPGHPSEILMVAPKFNVNDISMIVDAPGNVWSPGRDFIIIKPLVQECKVGFLLLEDLGADYTYFAIDNPWFEGIEISNTEVFDGVAYNGCDIHSDRGNVVVRTGTVFSVRTFNDAHVHLNNCSYGMGAGANYELISSADSSSVTGDTVIALDRIPFKVNVGKPFAPGRGPIFECQPMTSVGYGNTNNTKIVFSKSCQTDDLPTAFFGGTSLGIISDGPGTANESLGFAATAGNGVMLDFVGEASKQYVCKFAVKAYCPVRTFTADAGTDTITSAGHGFVNNVEVDLSSSGTLPAGLPATGFIVNATTDTFQIATTVGGAAVDITDTGSGTHSISQIGSFDLRIQNIDAGAPSGVTALPTNETWKTWCINGITPSVHTTSQMFVGGNTATVVRQFLIAQMFVQEVANFAESAEVVQSTVFPSTLDGPNGTSYKFANKYGATGDGSTNDRAAIAAADALGAVTLPAGTYSIASNLTINNSIKFEPGAKIKPANGVTVTLNGGYSAEDTQHVFDLSLGGTIVSDKISYMTPDHFGATASSPTNLVAFQKAVAAAVASGVSLEIPAFEYELENSLVISSANVKMFGKDSSKSALYFSAGGLVFSNAANPKVESLTVRGNGQDTNGIYFYNGTSNASARECTVRGFGAVPGTTHAALQMEVVTGCLVTDCVFELNNGGSTFADVIFTTCKDIVCTNNRCISANGTGISVDNNPNDQDMRFVISNNFIKGKSKHGMVVGYVADIHRGTITGNTIYDCNVTGMYIQGGSSDSSGEITITGNIISHCGGSEPVDDAGNCGVYISGNGGTFTGNFIGDSGYDTSGSTRGTGRGRSILFGHTKNWTINGNTIKNSANVSLDFLSQNIAKNIVVTGNTIVDGGNRLIYITNSGTGFTKNITVTNNVIQRTDTDGAAIAVTDYGGQGTQITITNNDIRGLRAGTNAAAVEWTHENYGNTRITGNTFHNWDAGLRSLYMAGNTSLDWGLGEAVYVDDNLFDNVTIPFNLRSEVYHAVGRSNKFVSCNPGFTNRIVPANLVNGVLDGYYTGSLPTRRCRPGDRLRPLVPAANAIAEYYNSASLPAASAFTVSAGNVFTQTGHGFRAYDRVRFTGASLPSPIEAGVDYFIATVPDANSYTVSRYMSWDTLALTSTGSGNCQAQQVTPTWVATSTDRSNLTGTQASATIADFKSSVLETFGPTTYSNLIDGASSLLNGDANLDGTGDANDFIGAYNGTWGGAPAYGTPPIHTGKSFVLNGTNYLTQAAEAADFNDTSSVTAWVKVSSLGSVQRIASKRSDAVICWDWYINPDGSVSLYDSAAGVYSTAAGVITAGTWHHVVFVANGASSRLYVDGVASGSAFTVSITSNSQPLNWGRLGAFGGLNYLTGELYQCAVWFGKVLTPSEIALLADKELAESASGTSYKFANKYDATGDGVTDDRAAIAAADALGAVTLPAGTYAIASNLTVTNDLKFEPGAKIKPANGVAVTCNGKVEAGLDQIFDLSAGGRVILDPHVQQEVCPEWWGAVPMGEPRDRSIGPAGTNDGTGYLNVRDVVDSTDALKAMFVAFSGPPAYGAVDGYRFAVEIKMNGWYAVTDEILVHSIWFHIKGKSPAYNGSGLKWCGTIATYGGIKYWAGNDTDTAVTYSQTGTTVTGASGSFSLYDVGKKIVWTSGANSGAIATITAIVSSSQVTVAESQTVAAGTIKYFRPATETSILHITASDNSVIENIGLYGKPTLVDSERILACLRFSWWPGTNVQRRIQVRNVYLNGHTDYGVETREGFLSEYGLLQGGPHSQDGNNDFHQIDNLLVGLCNHGIRIEQAQAVDWQINNYGFGYGNVMLSCKVDCIWYGKGWYAASDTWEGVLKFEGDINTVSHFKLDNFSCEHLRGHYLIRTLGSNVFGSLSGTLVQKIQGPQYRTIAVALDGGDYVATVNGGDFTTIGVPGMSNFFTPYMEGMQLNWKTGANTNATAVIDTVLGPTQAIVTGMSTGGAIAEGVATLTDVNGENIFKIFDGAGAVSCHIDFRGLEFGESAVTLYQTEYPVPAIFLYRLGNTEQSTTYKFTYNSCWSPLYKSYILDTNASELYFGSTVDFVMVGCRTTAPMPGVVNRRYMNDTEDGNGRVSIASYMTDAIDSTTVDTIRFGSMLGGLENQLKTQAHRILSNTQSTITVEDFFKAGRLYAGLTAYPWQWYGNWSGGGSALAETRIGVPGDLDAWGTAVFNVSNVHSKPQTVVYETDTDLVISIVFNSARAAWTFSQSGTTVTGASGAFTSADIGKVITWTSGANSGATATIVSITSGTTVEVAESQTVAAGTIEYPIALQAAGYLLVQPTWFEFGLNPIQFSTNYFANIATETLKGENLFSKTEEPDNAYWGFGELTFTTNTTNNPYGRATADKLVPSTNISSHLINKTVTGLSANQAYTFSVRVKADGYNHVLLQLGGNARYFNASSGVAGTTSGTVLASGSESLGNGWYNCWVTQLANGSGEAAVVLYVCDADNSFGFAGDGTSGVLVGGMQLNKGYGPAPYLRVE